MTESAANSLVRNLAHDLRQPLSTVENCVYYLSMVAAPQDTRFRQHLDLIQSQVEEVERILNAAIAEAGVQREARAGAGESFALTSATTSVLT